MGESMKSHEKAAGSSEKSKASRWVIGVGLVFMVGMFVASVTPFGLAVWLGPEEGTEKILSRIQKAQLHRETGALESVFRIPVPPQEIYWREVSIRKPLRGTDIWAVLHYDEAGFEALSAQLPVAKPVGVKVFLPWLLEDVEKNMGLKLSHEVEVLKLPSELFAAKAVLPKAVGAYWVPSKQSLLLMRFGTAEFVSQ